MPGSLDFITAEKLTPQVEFCKSLKSQKVLLCFKPKVNSLNIINCSHFWSNKVEVSPFLNHFIRTKLVEILLT